MSTVSSGKYPRTLHLPNSLGISSNDKVQTDLSNLLNKELIITEKIDGSNCCMTRNDLFARSHMGPPTHDSFCFLKRQYAQLRYMLPEDYSIFIEYCFAVHSIIYTGLKNYLYLIAVRNDKTQEFLSWDDCTEMAEWLDIPTAPVLFKTQANTEKELLAVINKAVEIPGVLGNVKEGIVVRPTHAFSATQFNTHVLKYVRENHVQTDQHWSINWRPQTLKLK